MVQVTSLMGKRTVVLAVADGMGGMQQGDRAAEIAIEEMARFAHQTVPAVNTDDDLKALLERAIRTANRRIWDYSVSISSPGGVGSTLVVVIATDGRYLVANVGDSRCYMIKSSERHQITVDHTRVQELVDRGAMSPGQARQSPYRHQLTNSLGDSDAVRVDVFPSSKGWNQVDSSYIVIVCSDGLHGEVSDQDIHQVITTTPDVQSGCDQLLSLAILKGSKDNITVGAAEFGRVDRFGRIPGSGFLKTTDSWRPEPCRPNRFPPASRRIALLAIVIAVVLVLLVGGFLWTHSRFTIDWMHDLVLK